MRRGLELCALAAALASPAFGQQVRQVGPTVRYGKWAAAAAAVGFTVLAVRTNQQADRDYQRLSQFCENVAPCRIGPDGRYDNPDAERLYRLVTRQDREARLWLVLGQGAVVATVALFVMELRQRGEPRNIPFQRLIVEPGGGGLRVGLRLR
ncbi:MAG TPA: hypothetical protein VNL98_09810 [Gemmatimonadales bacterium]|nr:hypothetical protein [Gemmatimonadales bacterium]